MTEARLLAADSAWITLAVAGLIVCAAGAGKARSCVTVAVLARGRSGAYRAASELRVSFSAVRERGARAFSGISLPLSVLPARSLSSLVPDDFMGGPPIAARHFPVGPSPLACAAKANNG